MNRLIASLALAAAVVIAVPLAVAQVSRDVDAECAEGDANCECPPPREPESDVDQALCQARACACPATKNVNIHASTVLAAGNPNIPPPFNNPASGTGTSRAQPGGGIICHVTGQPVSGTPPACSHSYNPVTQVWTSSGNCAAPGTATGGVPAWCSQGKAGLAPAVRAALDADVQAKLASACDCAIVNENSSCAGNCAPDAANPPARVPTNGRPEMELSFSRQANGSVVVSIIEVWTIHCTGACA